MFSVFRPIGECLYAPEQSVEMEVSWEHLFSRLELLLDTINTEQDRTKLEVSVCPKFEKKSLNVWNPCLVWLY